MPHTVFPEINTTGRRRFSSSNSVKHRWDNGGDYDHQLWLPVPATKDKPEQPGYLVATAFLDSKGHLTGKGNVMDRYHYKTAVGLVRLAQAGFEPALTAVGIYTTCSIDNRYYNRNCTVRVAFPSSATLAANANPLLRSPAAPESTLQFRAVEPGMYSTEFFLELMAAGRYPLSGEYSTPEHETNYIDFGSHDVLQHAAAVMALSGTRAFTRLRERCNELTGESNLSDTGGDSGRWKTSRLGHFMRAADNTLTANAMSDIADYKPEAARSLGQLIGLRFNKDLDPFIEEVRANITDPIGSDLLSFD